jgi:hypothetical protein
MSGWHRELRLLITAGGLAAACVGGAPELPPGSRIQASLVAALPEGWSLIESREGQAPPGHGPTAHNGRSYLLLGPGPVTFQWKDAGGQWHGEPLAREALEIWVMPGSHRPSLRRFFEHHRHLPPERIHSSERVRVYGRLTHRIVDQDRFDALLRVAHSTSWSDIADPRCTWRDWRQEISTRLRSDLG